MNEGMCLVFAEKDPDLFMKQESSDLSHLAPAAGDECISLDHPSFSMFHDLILDDNFLPDGFDSLDSAEASFLDYDGSSLSDNAPSDFLQSPLHSKNSDNLLTPCDSPSSEDLLKNISESSAIDSQSLSFIPASEDDLPLIGAGDMVMWGALPDHVNLHREIRNKKPASNNTTSSDVVNAPSLARLLTDTVQQISVEATDLLSNIYPEQNVLSVWNNEESTMAIEPVQNAGFPAERASKRTIKKEISDQMDNTKRQKYESNQLWHHLMSNKKDTPTNTQLMPNKAKLTQSTSRNLPTQTNSVLMNLLVSGVDVSAGYVCLVQRKPRQKAKA